MVTASVDALEGRRLMTVTLGTPLTVAPASSASVQSVPLTSAFATDDARTIVRFLMQAGTGAQANVDIQLYDSTFDGHVPVPTTVNNFLSYVHDGSYNNTFIHRALNFNDSTPTAATQFLQGGGFGVTSAGQIATVASRDPINLEYHDENPNVAMTIAMARTSATNSATSGFFFNTLDNSSIFTADNPYAVFGTVIAGQDALTGYSSLGSKDASTTSPFKDSSAASAFTTVPFAGDQSVSATNLIYVRSAVEIPKLTYAVSSSNTSVVTGSIDAGNNLVLHYHAGGTATLTLTATDRTGATATSTVDVTAIPTTDITLGGAITTLAYADADGSTTTYKYAGGGSAVFSFDNAQAPITTGKAVNIIATPGKTLLLEALNITGSTAKSSLLGATSGGTTAGTTVGAMSVPAFGKLTLPGLTITSALELAGPVAAVSLGGFATGATGSIAAAPGATVSLGNVNVASVTVTGALKSLSLGALTNGTIALTGSAAALSTAASSGGSLSISATAGNITLGPASGTTFSIGTGAGKVKLNGAFADGRFSVGGPSSAFSAAAPITGSSISLQDVPTIALLTLEGSGFGAGSAKSVKVAGDLGGTLAFTGAVGAFSAATVTSGDFDAGGSVQSIKVAGAVSAGSLTSQGNFGKVSLGSFTDRSYIQAASGAGVAVRGAVTASTVFFPTGPLTSFSAAVFTDSILAIGVSKIPSAASDFTKTSAIKTINITGGVSSFGGDGIYVGFIQSAKLGTVVLTSGQNPTSEIVVQGIGSLSGRSSSGAAFSANNVSASSLAVANASISNAGLGSVLSVTAL